MTFTWNNGFEGIPPGTAVTSANSGGASGQPFSGVTTGSGVTLQADNSRAATGLVSCQVASGVTSASSHINWTITDSSVTQWFRLCLYLTADPASTMYVGYFGQGGTRCSRLGITTAGKVTFQNAAGGAVITTTTSVPTGSWFRVEGFMTGDPSVGQLSISLYPTAHATTATETDTSAAAQATLGPATSFQAGLVSNLASAGPFWMDDLGLSSAGPLGPLHPGGGSLIAAFPF